MKKTLLLLASISAFSFGAKAAIITITDADLATGTYNWTKDNTYLVDGLVFLEAGGKLNIEAGTVIRFKADPTPSSDNTSALFITRGAQIFANGTKENPIIFTAEIDDLDPDGILTKTNTGLWGGLVLLGNAPAYSKGVTNAIQIEGIPSSEVRGQFGGNDPADNSGKLTYVSIRYTGVGFQPGDELQGLTLGGVGSGTIIDYVEVYVSGDDGVEIFGGTVNLKHFAVAFATDDSYDFDLGYRGKCQFLFAIQRSDAAGYDHIGEWDGASPDDAPLYSSPDVYNCTFIGPGTTATGRKRAVLMRENYAGTVYNVIFTDFPGKGIEVQDLNAGNVDSYQKLIDGEIVLSHNTWTKMGPVNKIGTGTDGLVDITSKDAKDNPVIPDHPNATELINELNDNNNWVKTTSGVLKVDRNQDQLLDVFPAPGMTHADGATPPNDGFFDVTAAYRGAFDQVNWLQGWTALSTLGYLNPTAVAVSVAGVNYTVSNLAVYPNPAANNVYVNYNNAEAGDVTVTIANTLGQLVKTVEATNQTNGDQQVNINIAELKAGIYFVNVTNNGFTATKKLIVQ